MGNLCTSYVSTYVYIKSQLHSLINSYEMNLMMLINSWLDINYQIITKYATVAKLKLFHQLNTAWCIVINTPIAWSEAPRFHIFLMSWQMCSHCTHTQLTYPMTLGLHPEIFNAKPKDTATFRKEKIFNARDRWAWA